MRRRVALGSALGMLLLVLWLPSRLPVQGYTRLRLADAGTGRTILAVALRDGEQIALTWTNSLFGLTVNETYVAQDGVLVQDAVAFLDPQSPRQVVVTPREVEDLYQTGGSFSARGLNRPFTRVIYRVGEIGNPVMVIRGSAVAFKSEVGFGGRVELTSRRATLYERLAPALSHH